MNLEINYTDGTKSVITDYEKEKIDELFEMLNNSKKFLRLLLKNKKQIIFNKKEIMSIALQ